MAWRCGSLSRSLISTARSPTIRCSTSSAGPRLRPPPIHGQRLHTRRTLSTPNFGVIGCTQSLLPLHSAVAATRLTSYISVEVRACCELSHDDK